MIEETAFVTRVNGGIADVESMVKSSCSGCQQQQSCGSGQVANAFPQKRVVFSVEHDIDNLAVGDEVVIALDEKAMLATAFVVYLWPLFGLLIGAVVSQLWIAERMQYSELWAVLGAMLSAVCGWWLAKRHQRKKDQQGLRPHIVRRCNQSPEQSLKIDVVELSNRD
ncbi:SoxR reducing system RseC family protein [Thalassotalea ponticola]|uniref:SoxR reducing system RseC family protein n=1 Tax=Thalassotalea ponticola TaxID=1523392 RepID=UPI0025B4C368|nr:SoxR reducing system RseC family protein [Thalassotalea ponticola]MDN3652115.1 SoxR reducing system RseC family protein [Thalassotalea ponticola]